MTKRTAGSGRHAATVTTGKAGRHTATVTTGGKADRHDGSFVTLRGIIEASSSSIFSVDTEYRYTSFNASHAAVMKALYGVDIELGATIFTYQGEKDRATAGVNLDRALRGESFVEETSRGNESHTRRVFAIAYDPIRADDGSIIGVVVHARDVSKNRAMATALAERERTLATAMGNLPGMAYRCANDQQWTLAFVSAGCTELTGYSAEELLGNARIAYGDLIAPEYREAVWRDIETAIDADLSWTIAYPIVTAGAETKWVWERGVASRDAAGKVEALEGLIIDMTAQHKAEERLEAALAEWRQTFDAMSDSVALLDAHGIVQRANAATKAFTGRDFEAIVDHPCYEVFHESASFHPSCPHEKARRSRHVETSLIEQDGHWLRVTVQPLLGADGQMAGGVHVVTDVTDLEQARRDLLDSVALQQQITTGVIAAVGATTEIRDPYTAGHQRRVGDLAVALARELGFDERRVEGVRVAAMLHDVGKITIPAEILAKPGSLSAIEFELIKAHAQASYDILAPIRFPWPVAEVALQHHERLDGSGYPQGLTSDAIVTEARIIAVADVVEAMSSHRPYRAALSMAAALDEVRAGAGTRYDAQVVTACLQVVEEQDFQFTA
jgi:PAS domain S-box-containing protein